MVRDRTIISWPSLRTDIRNAGGNWVDEEVVVAPASSRAASPDYLPAFCEKARGEISEGRHAEQVARTR